jgi:hypothetical protein
VIEVNRDKLVGTMIRKLERARNVEVARNTLKPLIERAGVSRALKQRALTKRPPGLTGPEAGITVPDAELREVMADFLGTGKVTINQRGAFELATLPHELSAKEAADLVVDVLDGWPADERAKIVDMLDANAGGSGEE